jgi:hypothetical protein
VRDCRSHSPNHGVEGGRVNEGPTYCAGKLYWGDAKKACDVDQYGGSAHGRVEEGWSGGLYRKAILGCREEGVRRRPIRGSAHGWPGGGANGGASGGGACRGASDGCGGPRANGTQGSACGGANGGGSVQGPYDAYDGANRGARAGCEEEKAGRRVASDGACGSAYGGANSGCSGQEASGGAHANCDEGRAD